MTGSRLTIFSILFGVFYFVSSTTIWRCSGITLRSANSTSCGTTASAW